MAFICKKPNREGTYYVFLVEAYRLNGKPKQRTLKSYGQLDKLENEEPGIYERLKKEAKNNQLIDKESNDVSLKFDLTGKVDEVQVLNTGYSVIDNEFEKFNLSKLFKGYSKKYKFNYDLEKILKLLVFMRIISPASKSATVEKQKELFGAWNISQNDMDRALDHYPKLKNEIQLMIHNAISQNIGRTATLVFYDVTNYYFETDIDDTDILDDKGNVIEEGMRRRGPSKEHRPKPIVQMGLFMDSNGIPISYELFKGNQTDPITYIPAIERVKKQFGLERIITVADKAMNSMKNVSDAFDKGDGWIFSSKFRGKQGSPKDIQEFALDEKGWRYNSNQTFAKKSTIRTRKLTNGKSVQEKVVVTWKEKYANREKIRRDGAIEFANGLRNPEKYRASCKKGGKKYLEWYAVDKETGEYKTLHPLLDINQSLVDFDAQFDGLNVIVTSETNMSDEEILSAYGQLYKIEDCFRVTKTDLQTRPVFVWTKEHIEAHFLTCFISLVLLRILQYKTDAKYSPKVIRNSICSANVAYLGQGYYKNLVQKSHLEVLNALGYNLDQDIIISEKISKLFSK
jgi:transposase